VKATAQFVAICWAVVALVWIASALSVKATRERQPLVGRFLYLWLAILAGFLLNGTLGGVQLNRSILPHTLATGIIADSIVFLGLVLATWARSVLGTNWSARVSLKEGHELVQRGPYRVVRHPIYSGLLLMISGTAVLAGQVSGLVAVIVSFLGLWIKSRQEEILLSKHFPEYALYKARTKALIPFLL